MPAFFCVEHFIYLLLRQAGTIHWAAFSFRTCFRAHMLTTLAAPSASVCKLVLWKNDVLRAAWRDDDMTCDDENLPLVRSRHSVQAYPMLLYTCCGMQALTDFLHTSSVSSCLCLHWLSLTSACLPPFCCCFFFLPLLLLCAFHALLLLPAL